MKIILSLISIIFIVSCNTFSIQYWLPYGVSEELAQNAYHQITRMRLKLIQSKFLDKDLRAADARMIEFNPKKTALIEFSSNFNGDMKCDIPTYFKNTSTADFAIIDVAKFIDYNKLNSIIYMPNEQRRLDGLINESIIAAYIEKTISKLNIATSGFFEAPLNKFQLDAIISKNNYYAGNAAIAFYAFITVPMGYTSEGAPANLTFIAPSFSEEKLLILGAAYQSISNTRKSTEAYQ